MIKSIERDTVLADRYEAALIRVKFQLDGIDSEDLTRAEKNILKIVNEALDKKYKTY